MSKDRDQSQLDEHELHFEDYALVSVLVLAGIVELAVRVMATLILSLSIVGLIPLLIAAEKGTNPLAPYCFAAAEKVLRGAYRTRKGRK